MSWLLERVKEHLLKVCMCVLDLRLYYPLLGRTLATASDSYRFWTAQSPVSSASPAGLRGAGPRRDPPPRPIKRDEG